MTREHRVSDVSPASAYTADAGLCRQDSFNKLEAHGRQDALPLREDRTTRTTRTRRANSQKVLSLRLQRMERTSTSRILPAARDSALLPFRGQVRVATRASEVLKEKTSISMVCCVSPRTGELVLLDHDLTQVLRVPLEYLTVTVVHIANDTSCCILHIDVDVDTHESSSSFFFAPASRAAADEWAVLLSRCNVPVFGRHAHSEASHTKGTQKNQRRNALNGSRPLIYWIKD